MFSVPVLFALLISLGGVGGVLTTTSIRWEVGKEVALATVRLAYKVLLSLGDLGVLADCAWLDGAVRGWGDFSAPKLALL